MLETNNFVYNVKVNEICIKIIKHFRSGKLSHEEIAKKVKLDLEIVDQFIEENESLLLETKKTYSQQTLKTLNDNLNALIKGEKKEENEEEAEDKKEDAKAEEVKEESSDDDKKVMNEDKESEEVVVKEAVEETSEEEKPAKKSKAKKPKKEKAKKRAVNQKFWYLTFDEIIDCLKNGYTTDEEISEKTNCKLNIVRKILYKLYDMRLASYKRDKDKETQCKRDKDKETQWYTYDWRFNENEYKKLEFNLASSELKRLNSELEYEENNMFFVCPNGHYRLDFEDASTVEFLCPECDLDLEFEDNQEKIDRKKEEIKVLEDIISG